MTRTKTEYLADALVKARELVVRGAEPETVHRIINDALREYRRIPEPIDVDLQCARARVRQLEAQLRALEGPQAPSGTKYQRQIPRSQTGHSDVYDVLVAFEVTCPARAHAIKKLLCAGLRGKGSVERDLGEAKDAVVRAMKLAEK